MKLVSELKRRNVFRMAVLYVVAAWLVMQVVDVVKDLANLPDWIGPATLGVLAIGFPIAIVISWFYELTPEGVVSEKEADHESSASHAAARRVDFIVISLLSAAVILFAYDKWGTEGLPEKSVAVLPFAVMTSGENDGYLADGLSEEILNSLAKTPDLLVAARTSSFAYKDTTQDVPTIATELGVAHVLEGSIRRGPDRLRVTAQLIRAEDGFHVWSETYDTTSTDIIEIQENIAVEIANALETVMDPEALAHMMRVGTASVPAYEAYLEASGIWLAAYNDLYLRLDAADLFEKAVELDPEFTNAYDRLWWYWQMQLGPSIGQGISGLSRDEIIKKRDEAMDNVIRTEKDPSTRLKYQAHQASVDMNPELALRYIDQFLEENPGVGTGRHFRIGVLGALGKQDRLDEIVEKGYVRGKLTEGQARRFLGALEFSQNSELARAVAHEALDKYGHDHGILYQVHYTLLNAGDIDTAAGAMNEFLKVSKSQRRRHLASLRQACAELRIADAERIYAQARRAEPDSVSVQWLTNKIMGYDEAAEEVFRENDERGEFHTIYPYLGYASFDAKVYPNFMASISGTGVRDRPIVPIPYRCDRLEDVP